MPADTPVPEWAMDRARILLRGDTVGAGDGHTPDYWMHETTGVLKPAIEAYLNSRAMTADQVAAMRAYLRQWIFAPVWAGEGIAELRAAIEGLTSRKAIHEWLDRAELVGMDPL